MNNSNVRCSILTLLVLFTACGAGQQGPAGSPGPKGEPGQVGPSGVVSVSDFRSNVQVTLNSPTAPNSGPAVRVVEGTVTLTEPSYLWVSASATLTTQELVVQGDCLISLSPNSAIGSIHAWSFRLATSEFTRQDLSFDGASSVALAPGTYGIALECGKDQQSLNKVVKAESASLAVMVLRSAP